MRIIVDYENNTAPVVFNKVVAHTIWTEEDIASVINSECNIDDAEKKNKLIQETIKRLPTNNVDLDDIVTIAYDIINTQGE